MTQHDHQTLSPGMIACRTCEKTVAKSARVCPHCGAKTPSLLAFRAKSGFFVAFFGAGGILILLAALLPGLEIGWRIGGTVFALWILAVAFYGFTKEFRTGKDIA